MKIKQLVSKAHKNAVEKGFYDLEESVLYKIFLNKEFTQEEYDFIKNAFKSQKLMLIVGEVAEAQEALRKSDRENFEEEIADIAIRLADFSGNYNIDLESEIIKKMETNKHRPYKHNKAF